MTGAADGAAAGRGGLPEALLDEVRALRGEVAELRRALGIASGDPFLCRRDGARRYRVSLRQWDRMRHQPGFPRPITVGGRPRWRLSDLEAYENGSA